MIQQEYRDSSHKQENALSAALKGGLVVGAIGAALAYQPWGRGVSHFLGRVHNTITETVKRNNKDILAGASSRHWTKTHYKQAYTNLKNAWARSSMAVAHSGKIQLRTDSPHSFANLVASVEEQKRTARKTAQDIWRKDIINKGAFEEIEHSTLTYNERQQVRSFVEDMLTHAENAAKNLESIRRHKLEGNARRFALNLERDIRKQFESTKNHDKSIDDQSDFIRQLEKSIKRIDEQAYTIENLERFLGPAKGERKGVSKIDSWLHTGIRVLTGSERLTFGKVLQDIKNGSHNIEYTFTLNEGRQEVDIRDMVQIVASKVYNKGGISAYNRLMNLAIDPENLFVDSSGKMYSKFESGKYWREFLTATRNTLPGKLLKIGDLDNALRIPAIQMINLQTHDPVLRDKFRKSRQEQNYHFRIGEDIYTIDLNAGTTTFDQELNNGDLKFVSGKFGFFHKIIESMRGMTKTKISDNAVFRYLDVFQDREEYSGDVTGNIFSMFFGENKRKKFFTDMITIPESEDKKYIAAMAELSEFGTYIPSWEFISNSTQNYVREYIDNVKKISTLFRQNTHKLSYHTLQELLKVPDIGRDYKHIIKLLTEEDDDRIIYSLLDPGSRSRLDIPGHGDIQWINKDLREVVLGLFNSPDKTRNKIELVSEESGISYGSDSINIFRAPMGNETYYYMDTLKREMAKELILRIGYDYTAPGIKTIDYSKINKALEGLDLSVHERDELEKLSQYAIFQDYTGFNALTKDEENEYYKDKILQINRINQLFRGDPNSRLSKQDLDIFRDVYTTTVEREVSILEGNLEPDIAGTEKLEDVVAINRSVNPLELLWHAQQAINDPLDILKSINEGTIRLSGDSSALEKDLQNIWEGLTANREDMSNANLYTFIPFWFTKRLSDELNKVGLGFSAETTTSAGNFAMSFITKRALPIFAASTYLDWTDDTTRELTGHGLWEGFTAGVANIDLGIRRGISALGMDDWLKETKAVNPIWQYWGDHDEYQSYEERQDYYQNGYTPVRKAAWSVGHAA